MVSEVRPKNPHRIVSHGKNGSPTGWPKQAGNLPQHQAHDHGIFLRLRVVIGPPGNRFETALLIKRLRRLICAAHLQKCRICLATSCLFDDTLEHRGADSAAPVLTSDGDVINVELAGGLPGDDKARYWRFYD